MSAAGQPLPMTVQELKAGGVEQPDFVFIIGDAYIDHPSFGPAIISRVLQSRGYSVAIVAQPDWRSTRDFARFGRPRLGFLVSSGNMDSMVNHYTAAKKRRGEDAYTPGGKAGARPDRAVIVYSNMARAAFSGVPVIIGGIEASLRRFAHYDYWEDRVRRSILADSGADLLIYGMGELQIAELADALASGLKIEDITYIPGTAFMAGSLDRVYEYQTIAGFEEVAQDKRAFARAFMAQSAAQNHASGARLVQPHGRGYLVVNPPARPLTQQELDDVYELPYTRGPHPAYSQHIPALDEVRFSLVSCRGCFGGCSFCSLGFHQGRVVQARSHASLLREAGLLAQQPGFKGYIHDVGGPTANFSRPACKKQAESGACAGRQCLGPQPCPNLEVGHAEYTALLKKLRGVPGVKKVFVRSGVRFDYAMLDKSDAFLTELIAHHISGRLKVAPEHVDPAVLHCMGKPPHSVYGGFLRRFERINKKLGKRQFVVPYFVSSHPGSTLQSAVALAEYLHATGQRPEQVQDFYPTPGTLSTCMYHTGLDPRDMSRVYVPKSSAEKAMQRALMQYFLPQYRGLARQALIKAGRQDLVGTGRGCLVPPERGGTRGK